MVFKALGLDEIITVGSVALERMMVNQKLKSS